MPYIVFFVNFLVKVIIALNFERKHIQTKDDFGLIGLNSGFKSLLKNSDKFLYFLRS